MENINSVSGLKLAIAELEIKQAKEWQEIKLETIRQSQEFRPAKFIVQSIKEVVSSPEIKDNLLANAVGLAAGFASKALIIQQSKNPIKRLIGTIVQLSLTKLISSNPKTINTLASMVKSEKVE